MKSKKKEKEDDYHVEAAMTGIFAVFNDVAIGLLDGQRKVIEEGSIYGLRKVELEPPGKVRVDGKWMKIPKGTLRLTSLEGDKALLVKATEVRIYMGRVPDWRLELFLVEHGYQADVYRGVQCLVTHCRDFGGNHAISSLCDDLTKRSGPFLDAFRRKH